MSLDQIKKIRELTGAGIVDVKEALAEAANDEAKAIEILRKGGQQLAAKRSERATKEGVIAVAEAAGQVAFVKLTCETDFVARSADFQTAAQDLAVEALELQPEQLQERAETIIQTQLIVKIGENIQFGGSQVLSGATIGHYLHSNKKVAAAVSLAKGSAEVARDIAMHVAALKPEYLLPADVPADITAKEKEIYLEQLKNEGKPAELLDKIVSGKLNKFYSEVCLVKQTFVKDDKLTVEQYLAANQAEIAGFKYLSL